MKAVDNTSGKDIQKCLPLFWIKKYHHSCPLPALYHARADIEVVHLMHHCDGVLINPEIPY